MPRTKILKYITLAAFTVITVRLFFIQIIEHDEWVNKADEQHTLLETIVADRGEIYMLDGDEPVAVVLNQTVYSVIIDPAIVDKDKIKESLNKYAKDNIVVDLDEIFSIEGLRYSIVAKNVLRDDAMKISEEGISGVWFQKNDKRVYPEGEMASGLLGFVNTDGLGQYGVEGSLNNRLAGVNGSLKTIADANNVALSIGNNNVKTPAIDGDDIVLTIDRGMQRGVEQILVDKLEEISATNAAAVIMDPNTGRVMAMANVPNYDPSNYGNVKDAGAYINNVVDSLYEPASVCKSFAYSAAINEGVMTAESTYYNTGSVMIDGWPINNAEKRASLYGTMDMKKALYWSLNTGSIQALKFLGGDSENITQAGREKLYDYYYNKFRLGRATGIELIEAEGYIPDPVDGYGRDSTYANMTFGQNMQVTMLQTAVAFSAVVNGGVWRTPMVVAGVMKDGELVLDERTDLIEDQILSEDTSATMRDMLINNRSYKVTSGIDKNGYAIGGKTGTAQAIVDGKYDDTFNETISGYAGFGGTEGELPKYVIVVKIWGEGIYTEGGDAMKMFDSLSNYMIDYLKIKPKGE